MSYICPFCLFIFQEAQNLALFKEKIKRSKQITENMVGILSSFENRLSKLEDSIVPIYNETGNLQRRQSSKYFY